MPTTDRHGFELWEAGFTQSDTILNDLLLKLEVKVGASVLDRDLNEPAGGESDGDMYIVGSSPTGAWASFTAGDVVILRESTWYNFTPRRGATAMVEDESNIMVGWTGSAWTTVSVSQAYVDAAVAGLFDHKGGYNASTNTPDLDTSPSGVLKGDVYIVTADGDFFTEPVQIGDTLIADVDSASSLGDWTILESNAPKNNDAATTDPGTGDDDADGYSPGSRWTNVTDDTVWFCLDASTGAAVWQQVESGGGLSQSEVDARVVAVTSGGQKKYFPQRAMYLPSTAACGSLVTDTDPSASGVGITYFPFDPSTVERVLFDWCIPERCDSTQGFNFKVYWVAPSTNTGTVRWELRAFINGDGSTLSAFHAGYTAYSEDAGQGTADLIHISPTALYSGAATSGASAGDYVQFALYRAATATEDTFTGDAWLVGVEIEWFSDAANDD